MNHKNKRATSNLKMLEFVARKLGELNNEVVYLGGCTTALFINDPLSLDVRPTLDVDCIIDVISLGQYYNFEDKLKEKGFHRSMNDDVTCRWHFDDIILDVMPTDEKILGWGNHWYKEAIKHTIDHQVADDLTIKSVTAPYFLATKIEAFNSRGNNDFLGSHDFEDIITVIAGCVEIADQVHAANNNLKFHLKSVLGDLMYPQTYNVYAFFVNFCISKCMINLTSTSLCTRLPVCSNCHNATSGKFNSICMRFNVFISWLIPASIRCKVTLLISNASAKSCCVICSSFRKFTISCGSNSLE